MQPKGIREALSLGICEMGIGARRLFLSRCAAISGKRCRNRMKGRLPRKANIDLGLAILASTSEPPRTARNIAAYLVVHVNASGKLSKKLSANLGQHSTETECLAKRLRMSFKDYRRNEFRYGEQSRLLTRIARENEKEISHGRVSWQTR
jgi:hypothetical protein